MSTERKKNSWSAHTWLVAGARPSAPGSPLNPPVVAASNYVLGGELEYARDHGTPTWNALEELLGGLERGRSVAFGSGMAAAASLFEPLAVGSRVVIPADCYQGVSALAKEGQRQARWSVDVLPVEATTEWIEACQHADLLWLESPSNPLLVVADLEAICAAPRKEGAVLVVDNTFATPLNQRPLELGADASMQSTTKFIGGHSDLLGGVVTTRDDALHASLLHQRELHGATPGALEAYLALRGARTMALRLERAQQTTQSLAEWLSEHPRIETVRYPGLPSDPGHDLATRQLEGYGAVISFDVRGGAAAADAVLAALELIVHATSLGGVESTMERRAAIAGQEHLPPGLLRLSVGLESFQDLKGDLEQALAAL